MLRYKVASGGVPTLMIRSDFVQNESHETPQEEEVGIIWVFSVLVVFVPDVPRGMCNEAFMGIVTHRSGTA